jgi:DNA/RNA-binding domain of Phe-tRNA-synthetase-like protein
MLTFRYHPDIFSSFPNLCTGVILAHGLVNGPTSEELRQSFLNEQRRTLDRIGTIPLSELEPLAAWRAAFRTFGVNPTKHRSAHEALLRRLTKKGDIPSINTLVDLSNLVSIRYMLPVATFDARHLHGAITVHFSDGMERYTPLGESQEEHPEPGEVIFSDDTGIVIARRWCWRQSEGSAANPKTSHAIITVEALHSGGRADVQIALDDLLELLQKYAGGSYVWDVLDQGNSEISG